MDYKKYNQKFLKILLGSLCFLGLFNAIIDPFNVFDVIKLHKFNFYKPEIKRQERFTKYINLKLKKRVDTIFCGSSRTSWALPPDYYEKISGKNVANMAVVGGEFNDTRESIYKSIKFHPEIKNILISIELERFAPIPKENNIAIEKESKYLTIHELSTILFSTDTTFASIATLARNMSSNDKKRYSHNGMKLPFVNKKIKNAFEYMINDYNYVGQKLNDTTINFEKLKNLINELNKQGIEVKLYIPPVHVSFLEIISYNNGWDGVDKFKKELAKVQPFYDFMYVHPINTEKIAPDMQYHFEASHSTYLVGEHVLDKIYNNTGEFGVLVTLNNVDKHNKTNRQNLKSWQKQNPEIQKWIHKTLSKK
ncbi:hypothetical protein J6Q66_03505 [bacterium]|nr:hypothetical protein [bacterium]